MSDRASMRLAIVAILALAAAPAAAGTISLAWDPVSHPELAGYKVYHGTSNGTYTQNVNVGLVTAATVGGLTDCTTYYLAVKAVAGDGGESAEYSNQVSGWPRPTVTSVSPSSLQRGATTSLTVTGVNFMAGSSAAFTTSGITVTSVSITGCTQAVVGVNVSATAQLGTGTLRVIHPDGVYGEGIGVYSVVADSSAPVLSQVGASAVGGTTATIGWTTNEPATRQVFYRRTSGQSTYQQTALDSALATQHAVQLTGLIPETAYQYYVRSVDASGNATTSTTQSFTTTASSFTYLRFEAEARQTAAPFQTTTGASAFGNEWVALAAGTPTGYHTNPAGVLSYGFHVPSDGLWRVWFRLYGPSGSSDGWLEAVDDAGFDYVYTTSLNTWEWVDGRAYDLEAGLHTLRLGGHEAQARIDRIIITDDPAFVPTEQPGDDVTPPGAATGLTATAGNEAVRLAWTDPAGADATTIVIRYRTDGQFPVSPVDGSPLVVTAAVAGSPGAFEHTGLTNGTTYSYAVFAVDAAGNASDAATASASPQTDPLQRVENVRRTDKL